MLVLFEFRSFLSIRTIAGPGGVIEPLPKAKKVGDPPREKVAEGAERKSTKIVFEVLIEDVILMLNKILKVSRR